MIESTMNIYTYIYIYILKKKKKKKEEEAPHNCNLGALRGCLDKVFPQLNFQFP